MSERPEDPSTLEKDPLKGKKLIQSELAEGYENLIMNEVLTTPNDWIGAANTRLGILAESVRSLHRQLMLSESDYQVIEVKITDLARQFDDYFYNVRNVKTVESEVTNEEKEERKIYLTELTDLAKEVVARLEGTYSEKEDSYEIQQIKSLLKSVDESISREMQNPVVTWAKAMGTQLNGLYGNLQLADTQLIEDDFNKLMTRTEALISRTQSLQNPEKIDSIESEKEPIVIEFKKIANTIIAAAKRCQKYKEQEEPRYKK